MLDFSHIPTPFGAATVETFYGGASVVGVQWQTWTKPRGKSMAHIVLIGAGGNGGSGVIGANSTAAGGGGGGSGAQVTLTVPLTAIPDILFLSLGYGGGGITSYISIAPNNTANNCLAYAGSGGNGGNAAGATAGAGGALGAAGTAALMPLGWQWIDTAIAGQAGIIGGTTIGSAALAQPTSGLLTTGGTGGGGLPAAATAGTTSGGFTVTGAFPAHAGAASQTVATAPPFSGTNGYRPIAGLLYFYGGIGGGSTHGTATGGGLVQASGGAGGIGCGGGGAGGALTGSAAGFGGAGGPAFCQITCW